MMCLLTGIIGLLVSLAQAVWIRRKYSGSREAFRYGADMYLIFMLALYEAADRGIYLLSFHFFFDYRITILVQMLCGFGCVMLEAYACWRFLKKLPAEEQSEDSAVLYGSGSAFAYGTVRVGLHCILLWVLSVLYYRFEMDLPGVLQSYAHSASYYTFMSLISTLTCQLLWTALRIHAAGTIMKGIRKNSRSGLYQSMILLCVMLFLMQYRSILFFF